MIAHQWILAEHDPRLTQTVSKWSPEKRSVLTVFQWVSWDSDSINPAVNTGQCVSVCVRSVLVGLMVNACWWDWDKVEAYTEFDLFKCLRWIKMFHKEHAGWFIHCFRVTSVNISSVCTIFKATKVYALLAVQVYIFLSVKLCLSLNKALLWIVCAGEACLSLYVLPPVSIAWRHH